MENHLLRLVAGAPVKGEDGERRDVISSLLSEDVEGMILEKGWGTASSLAHSMTISQRKFGRI